MSHPHTAIIDWKQPSENFAGGEYSRDHTWTFGGGTVVNATAAPGLVPAQWSSACNVNPEEGLVAAISSCHMMVYLYLASRHGFEVTSYHDEAVGVMSKTERGVPWISKVTLRPAITFGGEKNPSAEEEARLHHFAHEQCFIANSVKTEVVVEAPVAA